MRLLNADGSPSEVSGNGLRGLGAILAEDTALPVGGVLHVRTGGGHEDADAGLARPRAASSSAPTWAGRDPAERAARGGGESLRRVTTLRVGNPQCVILADRLDEARLHRMGPALQRTRRFPTP